MSSNSAVEAFPGTGKPLDRHIAKAQRLCRDHLGRDVAVEPDPSWNQKVGWSPNVLVAMTTAQGDMMVKMPRETTDESISACRNEARRAQWAGSLRLSPPVLYIDDTTGAFIMSRIQAQSLTSPQVVDRLAEVMRLLRRFHEQEIPNWFPRWDFFEYADAELCKARETSVLSAEDLDLVQTVLSRARAIVTPCARTTVCHNDFWSTNILTATAAAAAADGNDEGRLWCIDFEVAGVGDPLWDVGYLAFGLETDPRHVARAYGLADVDDQRRVVAYHVAATAWLACWSANASVAWHAFMHDCLDKIRVAARQDEW